MINFTYCVGILEAGDTETDREWCWFKGDQFIAWTDAGDEQPEIWIPEGAGVTQVKAIIRRHARGDAMG
ncbi:hypothetical protein [Aeromonas media]|uniref:hypothetical protein n=1 Tax=Aeromonas media TaxID=651 RepID=UPI00111A59C1|nr:hypothetical protein [Aeromonas media]